MNNIFKKNIVQKEDTHSSDLPHSTENDVTVKTNQIVHAALNYAFQKLIDNDLYIEKKLIYDSNYTLGPIKKNEDEIPLYEDNIKFFDGIDGQNNDLSIIQKVPYDLTATLEPTLELSTNALFDNVYHLAPTTKGIYKSEDRMKSWTKLDKVDGLMSSDYNVKHMQNGYDQIIFTTNDGIYKISNAENINKELEDNASCSKIYNYNESQLSDKQVVAAAVSGNTLFIGTNDGMYTTTAAGALNRTVIRENNITSTVADIAFLNGKNSTNQVVVGTNNGLYCSKLEYALYNADLFLEQAGIVYSKQLSDNLYIAANVGLSCIDSAGGISQITGLENIKVNKVVSITTDETKVYACTNGNGIFEIYNGTATRVLEYFNGSGTNVYDLVYVDEKTAVLTNDKLVWHNGTVDNNLNTTIWYNVDGFSGNTVIGIIPYIDQLIAYTRYNLYKVELDLNIGYHLEPRLSVLFDNKPDITTVYFDEEGKVLIGTISGLVDGDFNYIRYSDSVGSTQTTITDSVNKIRYINFFGEDVWCICTTNGVYLLKYNEADTLMQWHLNDNHILTGKNIIDISYDAVSKSIVAASTNKLYTLVIPTSVTGISDAFTEVKDDDNYTEIDVDTQIISLANLKGLLVLLKKRQDNNGNIVVSYEAIKNFAAELVKTNVFDGVKVDNIINVKTFVTNGYKTETYAVITNADSNVNGVYKYIRPNSDNDAIEFKKISPNLSELSAEYNKIDFTLAYRHLIPSSLGVPQTVSLMPSDRFSQLMLVTKNDTTLSAYDIYDMKLSKYDDYSTYEPEDIYTNLGLGTLTPSDSVKVSKLTLGSNIKDINYTINTLDTNTLKQQKAMQGIIATENGIKVFGTTINAIETLTDAYNSNSSESNSDFGIDQMYKFSLIPYTKYPTAAMFERNFAYVGVSETGKAYKYFENSTEENDFDTGKLLKIDDYVIKYPTGIPGGQQDDIAFYDYAFNFDMPFNSTSAVLIDKYTSTSGSNGSVGKFIVFASSIGVIASILTYNQPAAATDWFKTFTLLRGTETTDPISGNVITQPVVSICRNDESPYLYAATTTNIYKIAVDKFLILNNEFDRNNANCTLTKAVNEDYIEIKKIIQYNGKLCVYGIATGNTYSLTIYDVNADGTLGTKQRITNSYIAADTNIAATADKENTVLIHRPNKKLQTLLSSSNTCSFSGVSCLMNISCQLSSLEAVLNENNEFVYYIDEQGLSVLSTAIVMRDTVSAAYIPCEPENIFAQYDYVENKYQAYFIDMEQLTADIVIDNPYMSQEAEYNVTAEVSSIMKCNRPDSTTADTEFELVDFLHYDSNGNLLPDDTMLNVVVDAQHHPVSITNNICLYLVRAADDKDDNTIDIYGTTHMFFTYNGDIYGACYGFNLTDMSSQLAVAANIISLPSLNIPEYNDNPNISSYINFNNDDKITCLDAYTEQKSFEDRDQTTNELIAKYDYTISLTVIGTTRGIIVKLPGKEQSFGTRILVDDDISQIINQLYIEDVTVSSKSITLIARNKTSTEYYLVSIPYSVVMEDGSIKFDAENTKYRKLDITSVVPSKICIFNEYISNASETIASNITENILIAAESNSTYSPKYNSGIKNERVISDNATTMYQCPDGSIYVADNTMLYNYASVKNNEAQLFFSTQADHSIMQIYENTTNETLYYGSGHGVFKADIEFTVDVSSETMVFNNYTEQPLDDDANTLLTGKNVESILIKNNEYCYEINDNGEHDVVVKIDQTIEDIVPDSQVAQLFSVNTEISKVVDFGGKMLVLSDTQLLVNKSDGSGSQYVTNITPAKTLTNFIKHGNNEFAVADGKFYYKQADKTIFNLINTDLPMPGQTINATDIVDVVNNYIIDSSTGIYKYEKIDFVRYYEHRINSRINCIYKVDDDTLLIASNNGLYKLVDGNIIQCNALSRMQVNSIYPAEAYEDGLQLYYLTSGTKVYKTKDGNLVRTELLFDLKDVSDQLTVITGVRKFGKKHYVFATNIGILCTYDKYYFVNNWSQQNTSGISKAIKEAYNTFIANHITEQHGADSLVSKTNNSIMPIDLSEISQTWQEASEDGNIIQNDFIDEVEFNGDVQYITAKYSNFTTTLDNATSSYSYENLDGISYIMKKYKSNMKEIYIHLPTTKTQYVNHVGGMQYCTNSHYAFTRSNAENAISGTVDDLKTKVRVYLDKEHFDFTEVYNVFINGNSLPLKIFTDTSKKDSQDAQAYFHSYMQPSIANTIPTLATIDDSTNELQNVEDGKYYFDFCCFGTDEQSIKIVAKSPYKYTIVFNSNNADKGQMNEITAKENEQLQLPDCMFIKNGYTFMGWALTPNGTIAYTNRETVKNLATVNNAVVKLYAVWKYYTFDSSVDTILTLTSNKKEFLLADSEPSNNATNVVVDYDYSGDTVLTLEGNGQQFEIAEGTLLPGEATVIVDIEN